MVLNIKSFMPFAALNLIGLPFGDLLVVKKAPTNGRRSAQWECICICGNTIIAGSHALRHGHITSCGCKKKEICKRASAFYTYTRLTSKTDDEMAVRWLYGEYRRSASKFSRVFDLLEGDFSRMVHSPCAYCGVPPLTGRASTTPSRKKVPLNGLDRVDSKLGYTLSNVVPCCKHCNKAKLDRTREEFIMHCKMVVDHCGVVPCQ